MKLRPLLFSMILFSLACTAGGCAPARVLEEYFSAGDSVPQEDPQKDRVYMDELQGTLEDFTGSSLSLKTEDDLTYDFDVSEATLECQMGMVTGDEVCVIYEGRLDDGGTDSVKVLKVADEYHHKRILKDKTVYGQIRELTCSTISIKSQAGNIVTFPIAGTEQYYPAGIQKNDWVYIHYRGNFPKEAPEPPDTLDGSHIVVRSISTADPLTAPDPIPAQQGTASSGQDEKQLRGDIKSLKFPLLEIRLENSPQVLSVDLSAVPGYFSGGIAPGARAVITYQGQFNGKTFEGIQLLSVTGEDVDKLKDKDVTFTASGVIIGHTANTVTILTADGAELTFYTDEAQNSSTGGMEEGTSIKITFHPARSRISNIGTGLKIEDPS